VPESPTVASNEQLAIAVYGSLESITSQNVYGALMLNQIAQYYTSSNELRITFNNKPLPQNPVVLTETNFGIFVNPFSQFLLIIGTIVTIMSI